VLLAVAELLVKFLFSSEVENRYVLFVICVYVCVRVYICMSVLSTTVLLHLTAK